MSCYSLDSSVVQETPKGFRLHIEAGMKQKFGVKWSVLAMDEDHLWNSAEASTAQHIHKWQGVKYWGDNMWYM